ncbi:ABC transporter permease subunit [Cellulomonas alba]|uniref:ABC transporter permease subunit n=1 Tax=Cellulomonas alba TaxID=3053467 RepID=A0ABT7SHT3_9CELL|nr:ABC transporter permease subunit [Cellulomonas alba]MDM7855604.1 ABC transporter permease subunit [Cellulomonas alba]
MTTLTTTDAAPAGVTTQRTERVTVGGLLRSEWIKFWTVKSTIWTLSVSSVVIIGLALLASLAIVNSDDTNPNPLDAFGGTAFLGPLAVAVLGALSITAEYSTGMIRSSFAAEPRRLPVIWAKAAILALVVLVATALAVAIAAVLQWAIFHGKDFYVDATDPQVIRALFGQALYVTAIALFAFALGTLMRQSAAAIATVLGVLLVLPILFQIIPWSVLHDLMPFLPNVAGSQITQTDAQIQSQADPSYTTLSAWQGFGVLLAYVVVVMIPGAWRVKTRDA